MASNLVVRLAMAALLLGALAAPAAADEQGIELGILGGIVYLDESLAGSDGPTIEPTLGLRAGGPLPADNFGWFADALYANIDTETFRLGARSIALRGGLEWRHPDMRVNPRTTAACSSPPASARISGWAATYICDGKCAPTTRWPAMA